MDIRVDGARRASAGPAIQAGQQIGRGSARAALTALLENGYDLGTSPDRGGLFVDAGA
jgi:hypothetical protein